MLLRSFRLSVAMCLSLAVPRTAWSDMPSDRLGAEALAEEAAKLMSQGEYEKGCKKYEESALLDESPSRLLKLASCHERRGKVASAWATLGEAAELAEARGELHKAALALENQKRLEPHIGRLKVIVPEEAQLDDLVITRDGAPLAYALWGLAVAIDPGPHVIHVTAPGRQSWQAEIGLMPGPSTVLLRVPVLQVDSDRATFDRERRLLERREGSQPAPISLGGSAFEAKAPSEPAVDDSIGSTQRTIGLVLAGTGVASLAVGTGFALAARSTHNDLLAMCAGNVCSASAVELLSEERSQVLRSNVALGVGLAALAGGAVVYFSAPTSRSPRTGGGSNVAATPVARRLRLSTAVGPGGAALALGGQF